MSGVWARSSQGNNDVPRDAKSTLATRGCRSVWVWRKTYLVTSDYYSDFFELDHLRSPSSVCVIRKLKAHFARHGIPEQLVTDNGSQFTSRDFLKFSRDWDFEHLTSSPHHSQGNGKAESAVKEAKKILRKCRVSGSDAFLVLLDHRNTPPASVQVSSAQRLRRTRSLLPMAANLLVPQAVSDNELCRAKLEERKQRQAQYYNRGAVDLDPLRKGDVVRLKPLQLGKREWQKGIVRSWLDERSYEVETPHHLVRRNRVHLRKTNESPASSSDQAPAEVSVPVCPQSNELPTSVPEEVNPPAPSQETAPRRRPEVAPTSAESPPKPVLRRSERQRWPPKRFSDFVLTKP